MALPMLYTRNTCPAPWPGPWFLPAATVLTTYMKSLRVLLVDICAASIRLDRGSHKDHGDGRGQEQNPVFEDFTKTRG